MWDWANQFGKHEGAFGPPLFLWPKQRRPPRDRHPLGLLRYAVKGGHLERNPVHDLDRDDRPGPGRLTEPRYGRHRSRCEAAAGEPVNQAPHIALAHPDYCAPRGAVLRQGVPTTQVPAQGSLAHPP